MTNYEQIKNMSVEDMVELLNNTTRQIALQLNCEYISNDKASLRLWLEREARE